MTILSTPTPAAPAESAVPAQRQARLTALDAWRGLTVLLMLLVNNVALGGMTPAQLQHAPFGGVTLTDLVFPWFLFCAGAALPFSQAAMRKAGVTGWARVRRLLTRAALLYLVGAFLTSATEHRFTLGLGVLQLIALATLCAALLSGVRGRWQALVALGLLAGYGVFLAYTPHSAGVGVVSETANPVQAVNEALLSPWGLRGLVSVVPTTALVLLGSLAARPLQQRSPRAPWLLLGLGAVLTAVGYGWAASGHLPFSKALWTPPYVMYSAGLGTLGILAMWLIADTGRLASGRRLLAPLTIPGRNALAAYALPILFKVWVLLDWQVDWAGKLQPMRDALLTLARTHLGLWWGGWAYTLGYILAAWLGLAWMARRGLIWKL
ncbi:DUF5009 domain-containing protein [Deinococcus metallilatus]|uniref:Acyltransferase n=1 Tax=Deinococcus metallilatus TaxID=1211322 RepID=A0AAJ5F265_9DEIO|nr:DUF5009 domain-containing protein [Deinococcus metallilatus]MBB5294311.1 putative acyltransferase [Deinococcus metallilatus]QBY09083.1 DUF5009 domain-containing protein [Deinococcus metallilatus]RXJ10227.1 DUF5009 domain-containing protein [Deinococcus metallilatus]TLK22519.1 DUF5009 domain-containing protein [Deinococcus metallilatus]GMA16352.1 hypothetical protein GCM10025871_26830 [Deinococcus metallilatus]